MARSCIIDAHLATVLVLALVVGCRAGPPASLAADLGGYWPLTSDYKGEDLVGDNDMINPGCPCIDPGCPGDQEPGCVKFHAGDGPCTGNDACPYDTGYASFNPTPFEESEPQDPSLAPLLYKQDFNPKNTINGGSYTWELWWQLDGSRRDPNESNAQKLRQQGHWGVAFRMSNDAAEGDDFKITSGTDHGNGQDVPEGYCDAGVQGAFDGNIPSNCNSGNDCTCSGDLQWRHLAFVYDATIQQGRLYLIGAANPKIAPYCNSGNTQFCPLGGEVGETVMGTLSFGADLDNNDPFYAGQTNTAGGNNLDPRQMLKGNMTEVRFWNKALDPAQISSLLGYRLSEMECYENSDCAGTSQCSGPPDWQCQEPQCSDDNQCSGDTPYCALGTGQCVECTANEQCNSDFCSADAEKCVDNACVADRPQCDKALCDASGGLCADCTADDVSKCPSVLVCGVETQTCDQGTCSGAAPCDTCLSGECMPECASDSDCTDSAKPFCHNINPESINYGKCVECIYDRTCDDNIFCNGEEYCGTASTCVSLSPPCNADECDEENDECGGGDGNPECGTYVNNLQCAEYVTGPACDEQQAGQCHETAYCEVIDGTPQCFCEEGMIGNGFGADGCTNDGWAVRIVFEGVSEDFFWKMSSSQGCRQTQYEDFVDCFGADAVQFQQGVIPFSDANHFPESQNALLLNVLFRDRPDDDKVMTVSNMAALCFPCGIPTEGRRYKWTYETTAEPLTILPAGLTLDAVNWDSECSESGCWVLDVTYTTGGPECFNSFYLPKAVGDDTLSYNFAYSTNVQNSFEPKNFPCRTDDYIGADGSVAESMPDEVTTCCLHNEYTKRSDSATGVNGGFTVDYRPTESFVQWIGTYNVGQICGNDEGFPQIINRENFEEWNGTILAFPSEASVPHPFLANKFEGMDVSPGVVSTTTLDPFFYQYQATIKLDEVELRRKAAQMRGTAGVETTVDTFIGFVNFKSTGTGVLDAKATQQNIHLEKTTFFTVSTHGTNDYTFLEYVNLRLIQVLPEDDDFSGLDETADRTVRTDTSGNAAYVQVTFTMGAKYSPNSQSGGLIPLDSVRAGRSQFFDNSQMEHLCAVYDDAGASDPIGLSGSTGNRQTFDGLIDQDCGPKSDMCVSPTDVPDSFVAFNIPLGFEVFDEQASDSLVSSIFVHMVINAVDDDARDGGTSPNNGEEPWQKKTTLSASIPIVDGGLNIFCDGVTAKTDLKDVATADIIVGSAKSFEELSRLRIIADVTSTNLDAISSTEIDSDAIEAGLMTLVLRGDQDYFTTGQTGEGNTNTGGYALELDDVITLHLMTDGVAPNLEEDSIDKQVSELLSKDSEDNSDSNGLDTNGYKLNDAFFFTIDRAAGIAELEPTPELLALCPFTPVRVEGQILPLQTCITRRDVRSRSYPNRQGALPTAMEILKQTGALASDDLASEKTALAAQKSNACTCSTGSVCCEAGFLQNILGGSDYARDLAVDFVTAIDQKYMLNGRWTRAYWINPGYEWTPTQTSGKSIFTVSQKVYMFALVTLDENLGGRRRMLLQSDPTQNTGSGPGAAQLEFTIDRKSIMANAFDVPVTKIAQYTVQMELTYDEACMPDQQLVTSLRTTFRDYLTDTASAYQDVQVLAFSKRLNDGLKCGDRRRTIKGRQLLSYSAEATVEMMIVFAKEGTPTFNTAMFKNMPGILNVQTREDDNAVVREDANYINRDNKDNKDSDSSGPNIGVIVGAVVGAVAGVLCLGGAALYFMSNRGDEVDIANAHAIQTVDMADLKAQLQGEV